VIVNFSTLLTSMIAQRSGLKDGACGCYANSRPFEEIFKANGNQLRRFDLETVPIKRAIGHYSFSEEFRHWLERRMTEGGSSRLHRLAEQHVTCVTTRKHPDIVGDLRVGHQSGVFSFVDRFDTSDWTIDFLGKLFDCTSVELFVIMVFVEILHYSSTSV